MRLPKPILGLLALPFLAAQAPAQPADPAPAPELRRREAPAQPAVMRDEDEDVLPSAEYVFNPIQAARDMKIGDFYSRKGNHRAAAARYLEATRWDPTSAEAYWKLAQAREKLKQPAEALDAYRKFLDADSEDKRAAEARRRISRLEAEAEKTPAAAER